MMTAINLLAEAWWHWMGPMLWQASLLIGIVWLMDAALRRWAWPQVRYALWLLVLLKLLIPPSWSLPSGIVPRFGQPVQSYIEQRWTAPAVPPQAKAPAAQVADLTDRSRLQGQPGIGGDADGGARESRALAVEPVAPVWQVYPFGVWILGMVAFAWLLMSRIARLRRWHEEQLDKQVIPAWYHELLLKVAQRLDLKRLPAIVFSDKVMTPAVCGVIQPVMFLPRNYTDTLSREEAEHVLLHEMAHLKRGDLWLHGLCLLLQIIYWFNPLFYLARKQIQHVREICCDLTVANLLRDETVRYRQTLLDTARGLLSQSVAPGMGLLGVFEEPFRLLPRLKWLDRETWRHRQRAAWAAVLAVAVVTPCILPMADKSAGAEIFGNEIMNPELHSPVSGGGSAGERPDAGGQDIRIRNVTTREHYVLGIRTKTERVARSEMWIGDRVIEVSESGRTIIVNLNDSLLTFVNHRTETYVETDLPLELAALFSERALDEYQDAITTGEVKETGKSKKLLGKDCKEFEVTSWRVGKGRLEPPYTFKVWTSLDVSFDLAMFDEYLKWLRKLYARDSDYRHELLKLRGLQMRLESCEDSWLTKQKIVDRIVDIERQNPPPGTYLPPEDYRREEQLTRLGP